MQNIIQRLATRLDCPSPHADISHLPEIVDLNPGHVWIEPTTRCNTRCRHCGHFSHVFGEDISLELYEKITRETLNDAHHAELIGYGEPLMARHFDDLFDDCLRRGMHISFTTNGILLRDPQRLKKLVRSPVEISVSIDGARKETYEFVRPYIKWEKMLETLEAVKQAMDEAGEECRCTWRLNFVPMKQNIGDLPDLVRLAHRYGFSRIFQLPLAGDETNENGLKGQSLEHDPRLIVEPTLEAKRVSKRLGIDLTLPWFFINEIMAFLPLHRRIQAGWLYWQSRGIKRALQYAIHGLKAPCKTATRSCIMPWNDTYVAANGDVYPCCFMHGKLGDLNAQDWSAIWNGLSYRSLRRTIHSWNPTLGCRYCSLTHGINGGDEKQYAKFFSKFQSVELPLEQVQFGTGFYEREAAPDGRFGHCWTGKAAQFQIPYQAKARLLRLSIIPQAPPLVPFNSGWLRCGENDPEPFDNTCSEIVVPLVQGKRGERQSISIAMEETFRAPGDPRDLGVAIHRMEYLV